MLKCEYACLCSGAVACGGSRWRNIHESYLLLLLHQVRLIFLKICEHTCNYVILKKIQNTNKTEYLSGHLNLPPAAAAQVRLISTHFPLVFSIFDKTYNFLTCCCSPPSPYILKASESADSDFQSQQICGKSAEISTTKVRKSIKSLTNASFKSKMSKDLKQEHFYQRLGGLSKTF